MNNISIVGRLGRDVELTTDDQGNSKATFSIAVRRPFSSKDTVDWFFVQARRKTAELCAQYLSKGDMAGVIGRVETYKSGDVVKFVVVAEDVDFLTPKGDRGGQQQQAARPAMPPVEVLTAHGDAQIAAQQQAPPPPPVQAQPPPAEAVYDSPPPPTDADDPFSDQ